MRELDMDLFDSISPIDYRYYGDSPDFFARLQPYVSERANIDYLLRVEVALVKLLAKWRVCPADVVDSAAALRYKELVRDVLLPDLIELENRLIALAKTFAGQAQIGRTHGQHAVPTTFGYAMALYVSRVGSRIEAIDLAHRNLRGKFSGAVGAFNALSLFYPDDPAILESELLESLGLKPVEPSVSSQIVEPESLTDLVYSVIS